MTRKGKSYHEISPREEKGGGGGGAGYVPLASQNPYLIAVFSVANHRPHTRQFWANVIFVIPKNQFLIMHLPLFTSLLTRIFFYLKSQECMTPF